MPIFDFRCRACSHVFEFERPFGSTQGKPFGMKAHPLCPRCKSKKTEKILTPPAIQFKGSGFYKTDSRPHPPTPSPIPSGIPAGRGGETTMKTKEVQETPKTVEKKDEAKAERKPDIPS